jgi:hypothetical protein
MGRIEKTVFISYRRANLPWALFIYRDCSGSHGYEIGQERHFSKSQTQSR